MATLKCSRMPNSQPAVARALVNRPSVILADEPSGSLDSQNKQELHKLFFKLRDEMKQTFVIVTHDESLAGNSDRILHMRDGVIESESEGQDVVNHVIWKNVLKWRCVGS